MKSSRGLIVFGAALNGIVFGAGVALFGGPLWAVYGFALLAFFVLIVGFE